MIKRLIGIFCLLLCAPWVWAEDYYWSATLGINGIGAHGSTPLAACQAAFNKLSGGYHSLTVGPIFPYGMGDGTIGGYSAYCYFKFTNEYGTSNYEGMATRYGDGCPSGKTYNAETGECISSNRKTDEQCAELNGTSFSFSQQFYPFCHEGCRAMSMINICGESSCNEMAAYTGGACEPDDEDIDEDPAKVNDGNGEGGHGDNGNGSDDVNTPSDPDAPEPDDEAETNDPDLWDKCPKGYIYSGAQCVAVPDSSGKCPKGYYKHPDLNHCAKSSSNNGGDGSNNGGGGSDNGGGSGNGGGSSGGGNGSGDGSGNGGGGSGGGNGSGDNGGGGNGDGNGDGNGNGGGGGGGSGDGNGECAGDHCPAEEDKEGSKVGGESCDVDLTCEGDAIQCAILKQQKKQACLLDNDPQHHGQMVSDNEAQEAADKAAFEESSSELPVGNLFNEAKNSSGWLPKSCPAPRTASIGGRTMSFDFSPFCQFATGIAPIIVLMASLFFLITVGRAVKG